MTSSVLDRARSGSAEAFHELVGPSRGELHLHCYRMLGSLTDAEDVLQETLLAAWRGLDGFAGRSSIRTWLYQIATNRCLNALRDSRRRVRTEPVPPFDPPPPTRHGTATWVQPYPDRLLEQAAVDAADPAAHYLARETVKLAFITAVQELPPRQVAALLLCDVLGFSTGEAAAMLATTATAVKGARQRARAGLAHAPAVRGSRQPTDPDSEADLARRFARAFTADDIDGVIALLTDDAWLAMPPAPHEYHGLAAIRGFLTVSATWRSGRRFRLAPTGANAQPAFGCSIDLGAGEYLDGVIVLSIRGRRIDRITRFIDPRLAGPFGLGGH